MELEITVQLSEEEIALFEQLARQRGCSFDDAVSLFLRKRLTKEPDASEPENVLFFCKGEF